MRNHIFLSLTCFSVADVAPKPSIRGENGKRNKTENAAKHRKRRKPNSALSACTVAFFPGEAIIVSIPEMSLHNGPPDP